MMEIAGDHRFRAPRELVWQLLLDPAAIRAALPGCERFVETGPGVYEVTLRVGLAAIKGAYSGTFRVSDQQPPDSYRLAAHGSGKPGGVRGEATLRLAASGGDTVVQYAGDVSAQGGIARLGSRLLLGTARLLIGQFFKAMEKQVDARAA
jgi:carbon monoxide dehydrogenase subunit G